MKWFNVYIEKKSIFQGSNTGNYQKWSGLIIIVIKIAIRIVYRIENEAKSREIVVKSCSSGWFYTTLIKNNWAVFAWVNFDPVATQ
jgi:hypothetical protein